MSIDFASNRKDMSVHYPPYTAPWGRQTKEPTHVFIEGVGVRVRSGFVCTDGKCRHCSYVTDNGERRRRLQAFDVGR